MYFEDDPPKMTDHVLHKMTSLYFEDDRSLVKRMSVQLAWAGPQPQLAMLAMARTPAQPQ